MFKEDLGYNPFFEKFRIDNHLEEFEVGRVIAEHKERYIVKSPDGEYDAEITGNMRFTAKDREDFPAVGDWVAMSIFDANNAIIHRVFPRFSILKRQAVGQFGQTQVIATNVDVALIVQAVDRDFSINRLERYLTICNAFGVKPVIVLSKADLVIPSKIEEMIELITNRIQYVRVVAISNKSHDGFQAIAELIEKGKTYCFLGSSGVGKSTLINNLSGKELQKTDSISLSTQKGRHVTTHRELIVVENGGILIDNPGMREVGIVDDANGLAMTFNQIFEFSQKCKFKNCTHVHEADCAVIDAVNKGVIEKSSYENFLRMEREKVHFESSVAEKRKKDKQFGKMIKNYKKDIDNKGAGF